MYIDIGAIVVLLLFLARGWMTGFLRQFLGLGVIAAVYFGAPAAARILREMITGQSDVAPPTKEIGYLVLAGLVIYVGLGLIIRLFTKVLHKSSRELARWDRRTGSLLGFTKGLLVVYLVLAMLVFVQEPAQNHAPGFAEQLDGSLGVEAARQFNVLNHLYFMGLDELREFLETTELELADGVGELGQFASVEVDESERDLRAVLSDPQIMEAVEERDYGTLLADERVRRLLNDPEFRAVFER